MFHYLLDRNIKDPTLNTITLFNPKLYIKLLSKSNFKCFIKSIIPSLFDCIYLPQYAKFIANIFISLITYSGFGPGLSYRYLFPSFLKMIDYYKDDSRNKMFLDLYGAENIWNLPLLIENNNIVKIFISLCQNQSKSSICSNIYNKLMLIVKRDTNNFTNLLSSINVILILIYTVYILPSNYLFQFIKENIDLIFSILNQRKLPNEEINLNEPILQQLSVISIQSYLFHMLLFYYITCLYDILGIEQFEDIIYPIKQIIEDSIYCSDPVLCFTFVLLLSQIDYFNYLAPFEHKWIRLYNSSDCMLNNENKYGILIHPIEKHKLRFPQLVNDSSSPISNQDVEVNSTLKPRVSNPLQSNSPRYSSNSLDQNNHQLQEIPNKIISIECGYDGNKLDIGKNWRCNGVVHNTWKVNFHIIRGT